MTKIHTWGAESKRAAMICEVRYGRFMARDPRVGSARSQS